MCMTFDIDNLKKKIIYKKNEIKKIYDFHIYFVKRDRQEVAYRSKQKKYEERTNGLAVGKIGGWKEKGAEEERGQEGKKGQT